MSKHTPDSLKGAVSPFLENLVIPVIALHSTEELSNLNKATAENDVITSIGPIHKLTKSFIVEKDRAVDIYFENNGEDLRPLYTSLSKESRTLLDYIQMYCLRENKLLCYIDKKDYMDKYNVKSRTTVWNSKKDLINNTFIAPTSCSDWFWINPKLIFKGQRTKVKELEKCLKFKK